jgi:hypothetical protein
LFFDNLPKQPKQKAIDRTSLRLLGYKPKPRQMSTEPWPIGDEVIFDCEVYPNFFLAAFKHIKSQTYLICPTEALGYMLWGYKLIGFNSKNYDIPIIEAAIKGESTFELSKKIVLEDYRPFNNDKPYNHIDIIEVAPLRESLKTYAGRLHCERMQDLPFDPMLPLTDEQKQIVTDYCFNDLDNTELVYNELREAIALREQLAKIYSGEDLRSKSDAQLAQIIMNSEIKRITGYEPRRPKSQVGRTFRFEAPAFVKFDDPALQQMLAEIQSCLIAVGDSGHVEVPKTIEGRRVIIGNNAYTIGMGGLHSNEKKVCYKSTQQLTICDVDVTGYYPNLINSNDIFPTHIGPVYNQALGGLVDRRETAKTNNDKITADCLKIGTNGVFGKSSDPYSTLYDPSATVQTTLSGQLCLLMEIEWFEREDFKVISANTDGVVVLVPTNRRAEFDAIVKAWEQYTGLRTEETQYVGLWARDVNSYIGLKPDGKWKEKGAYCERGSALNSVLSRNPESFIVIDAVKLFLKDDVAIRYTIEQCKDMRRFVCVRKASNGAHKDGVYLGKTIRWYYAKGQTGFISKMNGDMMPKTQGAKPLMEMSGLEPDIDYDWYCNAAEEMLYDIGFYKREKEVRLI